MRLEMPNTVSTCRIQQAVGMNIIPLHAPRHPSRLPTVALPSSCTPREPKAMHRVCSAHPLPTPPRPAAAPPRPPPPSPQVLVRQLLCKPINPSWLLPGKGVVKGARWGGVAGRPGGRGRLLQAEGARLGLSGAGGGGGRAGGRACRFAGFQGLGGRQRPSGPRACAWRVAADALLLRLPLHSAGSLHHTGMPPRSPPPPNAVAPPAPADRGRRPCVLPPIASCVFRPSQQAVRPLHGLADDPALLRGGGLVRVHRAHQGARPPGPAGEEEGFGVQ